MRFAERVGRIEPSATLAISNKAAALGDRGVDVIDLSVGEPDFETPANIVRAGRESMEAGDHGYTPSNGIPALREAISDAFADDGLRYDPEQIVVTPGAKQALFEVVLSTVDHGDEVVLFDPAWVSYEAMVRVAGGAPVRVDLSRHAFQLEPALAELTGAVSEATQLILLNSPANPSGAVFSRTALEGVRDLAVEHDVTVVADEIYREITYRDDYPSLGTLEGMGDRTITVNGFSKAYAMTGWRLGYYAGAEELVAQAGKLHSHSVSCATNFVQQAGVEALHHTDAAVKEMVDEFEARRDHLIEQLADQGVEVPVPDGAFYLMLPVADDDTAWCERALETAHVATVPGSAFGTPGYARVSYANSQARLRSAIERLGDAGLLTG